MKRRKADSMARRQARPSAAVSPGGAPRNVAKFEEAVYVLHVFAKKTRKAPPLDVELAKKRYRELLERRKRCE